MLKPVVVGFDCVEHDPIEEWVPPDPFDVDCWVNFTIGLDESAGDNFLVRIVTPNNLCGPNAAKNAVVVNEYSWSKALAAIERVLEESQGISWPGICHELSKRMLWEYDSYKP